MAVRYKQTHYLSSRRDTRTQTRRSTIANGSLRCEIRVLTDEANLLNAWLSAWYRLSANARSCYFRWTPHRIIGISCKATSQSGELVADGWDIFTPTVRDGCYLGRPRFASVGPVVIPMNLLKEYEFSSRNSTDWTMLWTRSNFGTYYPNIHANITSNLFLGFPESIF